MPAKNTSPVSAAVAAATAPARGQIALVLGVGAFVVLLGVLGLLWASGTLTRWRIENAEKTAAHATASAVTSEAETRIANAVAQEVQQQLGVRERAIVIRTEGTTREIQAAPGASTPVHPDGYGAFMRGVCRDPARAGDDGCAGYRTDAGNSGAQPGRNAEAPVPPR
ncbi:hypothetical protein W2_gp025 [Caulobacter phage W2]|uniref:Uncharacterized protein n=1 Tax=Caulobacter phage TMCBR4 TaxID=3028191 RepID=A0AAE9ZHS9_9CAUD|nr:hypothetical protein TMCBR4_gp025 [Caulobacter phage TMCBR4]WDS38393.1 hypothetical protein W2_gp025 [Caulobacter phage W2]